MFVLWSKTSAYLPVDSSTMTLTFYLSVSQRCLLSSDVSDDSCYNLIRQVFGIDN